MLTKGDDYPIHQLPEPILFSGSDRNFYDRYFFNGYSMTENVFFALALGVYPNLNIMDAAFSVIKDGIQHNLRASKHMNMERMDTCVGPITVEVLEPLNALRIIISENKHGISGEITFTCRIKAQEEPRYIHRTGTRTLMDVTRMTQNGSYQGWIDVKGSRIELTSENWLGTRDRSWGIRPIGAQDPQLSVPFEEPQFYWLWAPINFDDCAILYHVNTDAEGIPWNTKGAIIPLGDGKPEIMKEVSSSICFRSGTRHAKSATLYFVTRGGKEIQLEIKPLFQFYMSGIGYLHPEWGHGVNKGELAVAYDTIDLAKVNDAVPMNIHIQAVSQVTMGEKTGRGVLEQLIIGRHAPSGFKMLFDMAP